MLLYAGYKECTVRLFAGMPFCYIYTLDVTEKVNVLVDAIGWESFCEELMERMDEDALDAVCDRIAPRYGVELAGSRYAA